jgi:hypothetical protein
MRERGQNRVTGVDVGALGLEQGDVTVTLTQMARGGITITATASAG